MVSGFPLSAVGGQPSAVGGQHEVPTRFYQLWYTNEGSHKPIPGHRYSRTMANNWIAM